MILNREPVISIVLDRSFAELSLGRESVDSVRLERNPPGVIDVSREVAPSIRLARIQPQSIALTREEG